MRLQSLELLPDPAGDEAVRSDWALLRDAGLPSLADHRGSTNAPHVTVVAAATLDDEVLGLAAETIAAQLPAMCVLAGLAVLGTGRRRVLARLVEVPDAIGAAVLGLKAASGDERFGGWLPHVTLAHRLDVEQVATALEALDADPRPLELVSLRHWDPGTGLVRAHDSRGPGHGFRARVV